MGLERRAASAGEFRSWQVARGDSRIPKDSVPLLRREGCRDAAQGASVESLVLSAVVDRRLMVRAAQRLPLLSRRPHERSGVPQRRLSARGRKNRGGPFSTTSQQVVTVTALLLTAGCQDLSP